MKNKKKVRKSSGYNRELRAIMDEYAAATGKKTVNLYEAAAWAIKNGKY